MTFTSSEAQKADELLLEYHDYSSQWRPPLGAPGASAACRQARSSRQWEDSTEASCGGLHKTQMETIEWCLDQLTPAIRLVIQLEMKSRADRRDAWRERGHQKAWRQRDVFPSVAYVDSRALIIPIMRKRCLFDTVS